MVSKSLRNTMARWGGIRRRLSRISPTLCLNIRQESFSHVLWQSSATMVPPASSSSSMCSSSASRGDDEQGNVSSSAESHYVVVRSDENSNLWVCGTYDTYEQAEGKMLEMTQMPHHHVVDIRTTPYANLPQGTPFPANSDFLAKPERPGR
mmetsp:Transcript_21964/g.42650  ORF Transcript_21964/g.42650 Transcript_21964/m.42650 type:complete len:151 (+) Transcript_21964:1-453(+)